MKKKLIQLADHLDKKGLRVEANIVDQLVRKADTAGVGQSLLLALEGIAASLKQIADPHVEKQMSQFVTQLVGAKDKFQAEAARLSKEVKASVRLKKTAIVPKEMMERMRAAATPAAQAAEKLLSFVKSKAPSSKQELDQLLQKFQPILSVIEKIQRASGV